MPIELPSTPAPNSVNATLIDYGGILRPGSGAAAQRVDRAGSRFRLEVGFPPMTADTGKVFLSRLIQAKRDGIKLAYPLIGISQGSPGTPVVNGAGQSGTTLNVRGCTAGYSVQEGYWLSISNGTRSYLHVVTAAATANGTGNIALTIAPALRYPFADGAAINLTAPVIDGFVVGEEWAWSLDINHHVGLSVSIEEWG